MKKVIAWALTVLLSVLGFIGLSFATIVPASAGNDKVSICHANESESGNGTGFVYKEVSRDGTANGHAGESHQNGDDIIPIFDYIEEVDGVNTRLTFPGQNTTKTEAEFSAADCPSDSPEPETVTATPVPPTYVPATCESPELPYGQLVVPADLGVGVASTSEPVLARITQLCLPPTHSRQTQPRLIMFGRTSTERPRHSRLILYTSLLTRFG